MTSLEPITSLLIRETSIAASAAGKLSRALWEVSRALRNHLQPDVKSATMALNKGESGAKSETEAGSLPESGSAVDDPFGPNLQLDFD